MHTYSVPTAKIIADSISPDGDRLTTMEVKFHRFILAEMNTHCAFARNSASSRAIPVKKQIERVLTDPAMPMFWGKNQAGMGASEELNEDEKHMSINDWLIARDSQIEIAKRLMNRGVHKQLTNRLLENWMWHTAIISATEWDNFFGQRCAINPDNKQPFAQPETYHAAMAMQLAYYTSTPTLVRYGGWHLPYITDDDWDWARGRNKYEHEVITAVKKISAGRCARVSYLTHDGVRDPSEDIKLADRMANAVPMHPSPFEHIAFPDPLFEFPSGKFTGWHQYRHEFPNNTINNFTPNHELLVKKD